VRQRSNKLVSCLFIPSFLLYIRECGSSVEDVTVWFQGRLVPITAAVAGAVAVLGSCLLWSHDFVL
jgi:hypothetical protein